MTTVILRVGALLVEYREVVGAINLTHVQVLYQLVPMQEDGWDFSTCKLKYMMLFVLTNSKIPSPSSRLAGDNL